ncbi:MAG: TIGR04282 family arsenosugar biosynthesis glycosyltransferase [Pseudomonadota bacterium]
MVKEPRAGRVKTRLGRSIGMTGAAWWYRHQTAHLLRHIADPRWCVILAVAPDREGLQSRVWSPQFPRQAQGQGDLGQRMARLLRGTQGPTVLIGSDIPAIRRHHLNAAFRALGQAPGVIGPAPDGGFWLVGLRHPARAPSRLFVGVRWSHAQTLTDTLPTLPQPVALIDTLRDVDEAGDL